MRINLINIALMLTGHVIQRTYREAVFDGAVENDNATTRGLVLSLAHRLSCHGHRLLDCHPLGSMVSPHAGMMSDTPYYQDCQAQTIFPVLHQRLGAAYRYRLGHG